MKKTAFYIGFLIFSLTFLSCEKEGDLITVSGFKTSQLSSNNTDIILSPDNNESAVVAFSWTESTLTLSDGSMQAPSSIPMVKIEVSATNDFNSFVTIDPSSNPHLVKGLSLNTLAKNLGLEPNIASPLYIRANLALGKNTESLFSEVITLNVTPYSIDMSKGYILGADGIETGYFLYSPESNGVYSGFMGVTGWYNWFMKEGDGTVWGNVGVEGNEFRLSEESTQYNMWFPGNGGCYFSTVNTETKEWDATYLPLLSATGDVIGDLTFNRAEMTWMLSFATTIDNATFKVGGDTKLYNATTTTDDANAISETISFSPGAGDELSYSFTESDIEFSVATAGEYTLKLFLADPTNLHYTLSAGSTVIKDPLSEKLYLLGIDDGIIEGDWHFNTYINLTDEVDSTYAGVVNVNSKWGYQMTLAEGEWTKIYKMGETEGTLQYMAGENITPPDPGLYLIEVNLKNLSYAETLISSVGYSGLNGDWTGITPMTSSPEAGVYSAPITITQAAEYGIKIYLNDNWDLAFGGADGILGLHQDGFKDDAALPTGDYDLIVNLSSSSYTLLGNEVYITGINDIWDFSTFVLTKTSTGVYSGTVEITKTSSDGFRIQLDSSWNRYFGGSFDKIGYLEANITDDQALTPGTYSVTVDFINNTCSFSLP